MKRLLLVLLTFGLCLGCEGQISEPPRVIDPPPPVCRAGRCVEDPGEILPAAASAYPRLSHRQYENTLQALFDLTEPPGLAASFQSDPRGSSNFDNAADVLQVTSNHWEDYQRGAETMAGRILSDPAVRAAAVRDTDGDVDAFVSQFGQRVFRRPLTAAEASTYRTLFDTGSERYPDEDVFTAGVAFVAEAMLQSPFFLYRPEAGPLQSANDDISVEHVVLDDWQLASRLSYFLWDSMPDDALFAAATAGSLREGDGLRTQASRMLDHPLAAAKILDFHRQLFEFELYGLVTRPDLAADIGAKMRREAERFVQDVAVDNDGGLRELLTSSHTFVDADLAAIYGLEGSFDSTFRRADLDPEERAGLLTMPGFLASHSGETAPILRGVFINLRVLCANLPEPPDFDPPVFEGVTRRERIDSVTGEGTCGASCHAGVINPVGFALENFDDNGHWRDEDSGLPVDAAAEYVFQIDDEPVHWDGPQEMGQAIVESSDAHECYVQNWLEFGFGRGLDSGDLELVRTIGEGSRTESWSVKEILVALVDSVTFRTRAPQRDVEEEAGE